MKIQSIHLPTSWKVFWILIIISVVAFSLSFHQSKEYSLKRSISKKIISVTPKNSIPSIKSISSTSRPELSKSPGTVIITTPEPTTTYPTATPNTVPTSSHSSDQSQELHVTVSINNEAFFPLTLSTGSNHCDVLNKALNDGKITSLNMKYDAAFGSYGVYQINGLGKENQIWWAYKVNGQSPSQGCSHIKVNNNDSIVWLYIGS